MKMIKELTNVLKQFLPFSAKAHVDFLANCKVKFYKKGEIILKAGFTNDKMYFVLKGLFRAYVMDAKGDAITSWYKFENDFGTDMSSYLSGEVSTANLEALETSILIVVEKPFLDKMIEKHREVAKLYTKHLEAYFLSIESHMVCLQTMDAKNIHDNLMTKHPKVIQRAPLGTVASYLGINQATLSRIRGMK
jgi:signal-transduction protein with cAMP-binding, CBS, and nucleotidyltransferase domain